MQCGLLGEKLGHSYSPQIHSCLANYEYSLYEKTPEELEAFLRSDRFHGLNVTIPYKKAVIPYLDELSDRAKALGAVNTVVRLENGKLIGHNTDYFGFQSMVHHSGLNVKGKKVLVLGSGGASATAVAVLQELKANVVIISRSGHNNYSNLHLHSDAYAIVNTTPVGMFPDVGKSPVSLDLFPDLAGVLDLVYNPARTALLIDAEKRGLVAENGLWMLVAQAKESAEWFSGVKIPDHVIGEIHRSLRLQMENIVLIGMPGCGKSTVGQLLAEKTGKSFIDVDALIVQQSGMDISDIFSKHGESCFRQWETKALEKVGKLSGQVIATGGGCVTREENYPLLHQNGTIIWLHRDIESLPTDGRPLSRATALSDMFRIRKPMYEKFSDIIIDNNASVEETLNALIKQLGMEESK